MHTVHRVEYPNIQILGIVDVVFYTINKITVIMNISYT